MTDDQTKTETGSIGRRSALAVIAGGAVAIGGAILGITGAFVANAFRKRERAPWLRVAKVEDLSTETFQRHVLSLTRRHAWIEKRKPVVVFVKDLFDPDDPEPKDPIALDATCSHLGCSVRWKDEKGQFHCPCHGAVYDDRGRVVKGPQPRALTRLQVKLEDEVCYVRAPGESA